jgi:hypothetical protein
MNSPPVLGPRYNPGMRKPKADEAQSAVNAANELISRHEKPLPADLEAAWVEWSRAIKNVDTRGMTLLRAAFEAGADAATRAK